MASFALTLALGITPVLAAPAGGAVVGQADDYSNSRPLVTQVQSVLRELGIYRGPVNGQMTPSTRAAIAEFQRSNNLTITGRLNREALRQLGIVARGGQEAFLVNVVQAEAVREQGGQLRLRVATRSAADLELEESHFRRGDAVHVYVRGYRTGTARRGGDELNVTLEPNALEPNEWRGVSRIVVHGTGDTPVVVSSDRFVARTGALTPPEAAALAEQVSSLLEEYSRVLGVQYNRRTGELTMRRANYRENEIELLFALSLLARSARLYDEVLRATTDPQALAGATDIFVNQANVVGRAINRTRSDRAEVRRASLADAPGRLFADERVGQRSIHRIPAAVAVLGRSR